MLGVLIAILSDAVHQLGFTLQKLSHVNRNQEIAEAESSYGEKEPLLNGKQGRAEPVKNFTVIKSQRLAYCAVSGCLGAQTVWMVKVLDGAVIERIAEGSLRSGWSYLTITLLAVFAIAQVHTMNMALNKYDATYVIPTHTAFWIIMGIFGAASLFNEFEHTKTRGKLFFIGGMVVVLWGTIVMTFRKPQLSANQKPKYWTKNVSIRSRCCDGGKNANSGICSSYLTVKFVLGTIFIVAASFGDMTSLSFAPASTVAPFAASSIVFSQLLAVFFLNEKYSKRDFVACLLLAAGISLCTTGSPKDKPAKLTFQQVGELLTGANFQLYTIVSASIITVGIAVILICNKRIS